jgi:peptidoglycan hydrolase-like protein with peptidoglycan-binding domain
MTNPIYDLMYRGESGAAGYNAYNRGTYTDAQGRERIRPGDPPMDFSRFTLGEVMDMQHLPRRDPDRVFAVGKYQIIPGTMDTAVARLGLDRNQPFTPEMQDRIFSEYLLRDKQPSVRDYIEGRQGATLQQAQHGLAREWASFGDPDKGGRSYYGGANRAHITLEQSAAALNQMRAEYAAAIGRGLSADEAWRAATAIDPAQRTQAPGAQTPQAGPMADGKLQRGERGDDVRGLQRSLNQLGVTDDRGQPLETRSGVYGPHTEAAVRKFQQANGLEPTGIADQATLEAIGRRLPEGRVTVERAEVTGSAQPQTGGQPLVTDPSHPNYALFQAIGGQLPAGTDPRVTASITLQALENGITSPDRLRGVAVRGSDVHLQGPYEGARVSVDLNAPTPDLQAMSDHMRTQTQERMQEEQRRLQQSQAPQTVSI